MNLLRTTNDVNGNPRYICHYSDILTDSEYINSTIEQGYKLAIKKAKKIRGKMFRGKFYGGGLVFQSYNIQDLKSRIEKIRESKVNN